MATAKSDLKFMKLAIDEARRSVHKDKRVYTHPQVGAVVARDEQMLQSACHGDIRPCDHAEFTVLEKKLKNQIVSGCTVYTTLEPCTTRNHPKQPCAAHLIERRVSRVVIGMLDPNQAITGKGILQLRKAGIDVELFPPNLMAEIEELNREFIRYHSASADLMLPAWYGYKALDELVPHEARRVVLIGQNLSSRLGLNKKEQEKFSKELAGLLKQGTEVSLVIMPPSVLRAVHLEAAEDLAHFTLPALEQLVILLGKLGDRVQVVFHPAATLSLLAVDGNYAYITPKFQKTAKISKRLTLKLEPQLFDGDSLERMFSEAAKRDHGARVLSLDQGVKELRSQLVACGLLQSVNQRKKRKEAI